MPPKTYRFQRGFLLPLISIFGVVLLTSLGLWYRNTIHQTYLSQRLLEQRAMLNECQSLVPALVDKLDVQSLETLAQADEHFATVEVEGQLRLSVSRSALMSNRIQLEFSFVREQVAPVQITIDYRRE